MIPSGQSAPAVESSVNVTTSETGLTIGGLQAGHYSMTVASVKDSVFTSVVDLEARLKDAVLEDPLEIPDPSFDTSPFESTIALSTDSQDLGFLHLDLFWTSVDDARYAVTGDAALTIDLPVGLSGTDFPSCVATATLSSGSSVTPISGAATSAALNLSNVEISPTAECTVLCTEYDCRGMIDFILIGKYQSP